MLTSDQIRKALANVYSVLKPGSPLYIVGWILDDSRTTPLAYATYNLLFVNDYADGLIHTEAEHRTWLEETFCESPQHPATRPISSWRESLPPNLVAKPFAGGR